MIGEPDLNRERIGVIIEAFEQNFGDRAGLRCSRAPGRVNLIGEHTDYNGGFVMPMAVDRAVHILFRPADRGPVRLWSENFAEWDEFDLDDIGRNERQPWANYVRGVAHVLQGLGCELRPIEGIVWGDVPLGAGLSSSAAIEVAAALALCDAAGIELDSKELALACQRAENQFVGVNCGIMDQFISVHARIRHALVLDCRSLDYELLPLDTGAVRVVVCNTMVHHELGSSAYNERRASCEEAARILDEAAGGIEMLRDVGPDLLAEHAGRLDPVVLKRARHVVGEIDRTARAALALKAGDYELFGELMDQSHESLRSDYAVSCDELDLMVELARRRPGVLGARMTGAGFGGCTVNLIRAGEADAFVEAVRSDYQGQTGLDPEVYQFMAEDGARVGTC